MKDTGGRSSSLLAMSLALGLGLSSGSRAEAADDRSTAAPTQGQAHARSPQQEARSQARPDLEKQRKEAEQQAAKTLDRDAVAAVEETRKAAKAIAEDKPGDAISDLEAQLKGHEDATSAFSRLKEKVAAFFKRQAETERR